MPKSQFQGIIAFPILFGIVAAIVILASAAVSATLQEPQGRALDYLCKIRPDATACKIKERCPELIGKGLKECPRPTIVPRPSGSPKPSGSPEPTALPQATPTPTPTPTPKPDLKVVGLSTEVTSCLPPECTANTRLLNLTARFRNDGPGTASPPIILRFWEDLNVNPTCNTQARTSDVAISYGLESGTDASYVRTIDITNLQPGQHFAAVMVDAQCKIAETNENNNSQITPYSF